MNYQTAQAPSAISLVLHGVTNQIGAFFKSVGAAMMVNSSAQRRLDTIHHLQAKSDAELAALKINRNDIVHHVFKDLYYI